jgi:predicted ATPase
MDIVTVVAALAGIVSTVIAALVGISNLVDFFQKQRENAKAKLSTPSLAPAVPSPSGPLPGSSTTPDPPPSPVAPAHAARANLPIELTSFFGREQEVAAIQALLRQAQVRLVTLLGPPGAGKSRLSLKVAATLSDEFEAGVCCVALAPVRDPTLVAPTIAHALGMKEIPGQSVADSLKNHLRGQQLLLVLDNFEQVIPAAPLVAELLAAAPRLKVLVTSREVLSLSGEYEFAVPPLPLPDLDQLSSVERLAQSPAVRLFVERTRAVKPDFRLTAENGAAVARLCIVLDGLPLAIELAAARAKLFSPHEMVARLESRFQWLTSGARDLPTHQQTLQGALDWSFNLLAPDERTLFRRLSVFAGGCTLEAVEAICTLPADSPLDVLAAIASLVDKSLLERREEAATTVRFSMLETIREYARTKLRESGEAEVISRQHLRFYTTLAEASEPLMKGPERAHELARLQAEIDNLRAALDWSGRDTGATEEGLRLAGALTWFAHFGNHTSETRTWLTTVLQHTSTPTAAHAKALWGAGLMAMVQGESQVACTHFEESAAIWRQIGDRSGPAAPLRELIYASLLKGDIQAALRYGEESVALWRAAESPWDLGLTLVNLGMAHSAANDQTAAMKCSKEALSLFRTVQDSWGLAISLFGLGLASAHQGDYTAARTRMEEALSHWLQEEDVWSRAETLGLLAQVLERQGEVQRATAVYRDCLMLSREIGDKPRCAFVLRHLSALAQAQGQLEWAVRLYAAADRWDSAEGGVFTTLADPAGQAQVLATLRTQLPEEAFATYWAKGQELTLDQAIEAALSPPDLAQHRLR